jgi:hypothetical protein
MFAIAHMYLMEQLFADPTPAHYLGCVWPDMLFSGPLSHHQTHRQGRELLAFTRQEAPEILEFTRAVLTHITEPHGFDWFSDEAYYPGKERGYAFTNAEPFVADVVTAAKVPPEIGRWKAHNFVEMSFEQALGRQYPHLGPALIAACADEALVRQVTEPLARHFNVSADALAWNITHFPETVALTNPTSMDLARAYAIQLQFKHQVTDPDIPAMAAIIDRVWEAIAPDRVAYLAHCTRRVADVLNL